MYGPIPLLAREYTLPDGETYEWYQPDPAYRPSLPAGAVRGDPSRQEYCEALHIPTYFYVDEEKECVGCGESFAFTGKEQQFWYEQLGFNLNSVAIRCRPCRAVRRKAGRYGRQIGRAREAAKERQSDPTPCLDLAEGLVRQYQNASTGNVDEAIRCVQPWGVDVHTGVESPSGRKDPILTRQVAAKAKSAMGDIFNK